MESTVEKFLGIFQIFINLCEVDNWPNDDTTVEHIREALEFSQYIENCVDKLEKNYVLNEFMSALKERQNATSIMKYCLPVPSKFMLKKILNSSANNDLVDAGVNMFVDVFSEKKLEDYLSDIMLEFASKDILLKNMHHLSKSEQADFNIQLFLTKLCSVENPSDLINTMLHDNCTQDVIDMLVECLFNSNSKYKSAIEIIAKGFVKVLTSSQNVINRRFWKQIFLIDEEKFLRMCRNYADIFQLISKALIDCGKIIEKNLSLQNFYVNLTYSEFSWNVKKICRHEGLKLQFLELLSESNVNMIFWERETQVTS